MMSKVSRENWQCLLGFAIALFFFPPNISAQEPKGISESTNDKPVSIVGTWENEVRHAVHASLYQPAHGTRLRNSLIHFKSDGEGLVGYSLLPDHIAFRRVQFAKGQLVFEFDIDELNHGWGHQTKSRAWVRVEAGMKGDRLIGKWRVHEQAGGDEVFRGEWEAVRAKEQAVGAVVLAGGGVLPEAARQEFFRLAGGKDRARIVVIPTASAQDTYTGKEEDLLEPWNGSASVRLFHTRERKAANNPAFVSQLANASGVWFTNGHTDRLLNAYRGTQVEAELKKVLERGGVVGGQDAGAVVLAERVHQGFDPDVLSPGYGLLPGVMSARGFGDADRAVLDRNVQYAGLGIPNETAVIVHGRTFRVFGKGPAVVYWPKSDSIPARQDAVPADGKYDLKERTVIK
jgi:cyanophycinase